MNTSYRLCHVASYIGPVFILTQTSVASLISINIMMPQDLGRGKPMRGLIETPRVKNQTPVQIFH